MTLVRPKGAAPAPGMASRGRHALAGHGPIVDRARSALRRVAAQFGEITGSTQTDVEVRTTDGIVLRLSYDPGNYVFSRVYNLTITAVLPSDTPIPAGLRLSHRARTGAAYVPSRSSDVAAPGVEALNRVLRSHLAGIDLHSSTTAMSRGRKTITLSPLGGSFVWVLIPPVFKATAFPPGEPGRILDLIRDVSGLTATTDFTTTKGSNP